MNNGDCLSFENIVFSYGTAEILHGVSAKISPGKINALFGPNGSGKTTLLKCLAGLMKPQQGSILVGDQNILKLQPRQVSRLICYVPQEHAVSFAYTVEEVVLMGRTPHLGGVQGPSSDDFRIARQAMDDIGISAIAAQNYTELSGGQRQLVLVARALAQGSNIMILDEPTSALDFKNQINVWNTLKNLKSMGRTILVCTHDPNHVLWFCDNVIALQEGNIIANGLTGELMNNTLMKELYGAVCSVKDGFVFPNTTPCV